jgi:hypothetical protein
VREGAFQVAAIVLRRTVNDDQLMRQMRNAGLNCTANP